MQAHARRVTPSMPAHRAYVGGITPSKWWEIGRLQLRFLIEQGLRPHHPFLDCACGALRAGLWLVPYLDTGNYLGLDISAELVETGCREELGEALIAVKRPQFAINATFELTSFDRPAAYGIAQSLFTHLVPDDISRCLGNVAVWAAPEIRFFATFFEGRSADNPQASDPHLGFAYSREEIHRFAAGAGLRVRFIDDFRHPRNQKMAEFTR